MISLNKSIKFSLIYSSRYENGYKPIYHLIYLRSIISLFLALSLIIFFSDRGIFLCLNKLSFGGHRVFSWCWWGRLGGCMGVSVSRGGSWNLSSAATSAWNAILALTVIFLLCSWREYSVRSDLFRSLRRDSCWASTVLRRFEAFLIA